jgi:hypothetical protein
LESVLPQLTNVTDLHLIYPEHAHPSLNPQISEAFDTPPLVPFILPAVTTFSVQHDDQLLNFVTLPALQHLVLAKCWLIYQGDELHALLKRSECQLKSLELQSAGSYHLHYYFRNPAICGSVTRLAISSQDLARFFSRLEEVSPGTLPLRLCCLREVDLCFRIDDLDYFAPDETTGALASLLLSYLPSLARLELDLEIFTEAEMESHRVSTTLGEFTLIRPTCLRAEHEQWWRSDEGQEFQAVWNAGSFDTRRKFGVDWMVVNGCLPRRGGHNRYSPAASERSISDPSAWSGTGWIGFTFPVYGRNLVFGS